MSDFTIKNLMDVEDSAAGRDQDIEARFGRKHLDSEHLGVSYFRYGRGFRPPFGHRHREQEEAYVVVGGSGRMRIGDEVIELRRWDAVRVAPGVVRAFEGGPEGLELIAIGSDRPEGGDGEMIQDFWTDSADASRFSLRGRRQLERGHRDRDVPAGHWPAGRVRGGGVRGAAGAGDSPQP